MADVIDLTRAPGPTVGESTDRMNRVLELMGQREQIRQDKQRINDFVVENIRLTGLNEDPNLDPALKLSPDEIAQRAAVTVTQGATEFDPGLVGGFQKFASGLVRGPSTTLTGPIKESLLDEPTGIRREEIKARVLANLAQAQERTAEAQERSRRPTKGQKQRDSDMAILRNEKATPGQKAEARDRLTASPDLFDLSESNIDIVHESFAGIMDNLKKLRIIAPGDIIDKKFGEKAYDQGLKDAVEKGLSQGADPASTRTAFNEWWDDQFLAEKGQVFQKYQDRKEFQTPETEVFDPQGTGFDIKTFKESGGVPDETGHMGSLDPRTGMLLKGINHPTIQLTLDEEARRGNKIVQKGDRFFSVPSKEKTSLDITALIKKALKAGKINQEEVESAQKILERDPAHESEIRKELGL